MRLQSYHQVTEYVLTIGQYAKLVKNGPVMFDLSSRCYAFF